MKPSSDFFDPLYVVSEATEATKPEKSQMKQFLSEPLAILETKKYGISKPTRIVIRGRIAKW